MQNNPFQTREPNIVGNANVRTPQRETYDALVKFADENTAEREVGVVLPVGCGTKNYRRRGVTPSFECLTTTWCFGSRWSQATPWPCSTPPEH